MYKRQGGGYGLARIVIAGMAAENVLIMDASELQILSDTRTANQAEAFCPCFSGAFRGFFTSQLFLEMDEHGVLVAGNHDVDVIRVNDI